jgi:hypothetical protein
MDLQSLWRGGDNVMGQANHSQRRRNAIIEENTRLKRRVRDLEIALQHYSAWESKIRAAIQKDDLLRAVALMKGVVNYGKP